MGAQMSFWSYFWLVKFFMQAAGVLPIGGTPSIWKSIFNEFLSFFPIMFGSYLLIPRIISILFQEQSVDDLLQGVLVAISIFGGVARAAAVRTYRNEIRCLFKAYENLWDQSLLEDEKDVVLRWARRAKLFTTIYFCAVQLPITTFVFGAAIKQLSQPENSTVRYYPFSPPDDSIPNLQYDIGFVMETIIGYNGSTNIVAGDMTGTFLALNICGQFALVSRWLANIQKNELTDKSLEMMLKKSIRRHQITLEFCSDLEEAVCYINLTQLVTGMYVLAISSARMISSPEITLYLGPLTSSIGGLFFSCWPADNLISVSSEVAHAVYEVPWYRLSYRDRISIAIMLMRSQRPAKFTAAKFATMSLETFSSIVSSAISFCMVLNSF